MQNMLIQSLMLTDASRQQIHWLAELDRRWPTMSMTLSLTMNVCCVPRWKKVRLALSMQISYLGRAQKCQAEGQPIMGIQIPCQ